MKNRWNQIPITSISSETMESFLDDHCLQSNCTKGNDVDVQHRGLEITFDYSFLAPPGEDLPWLTTQAGFIFVHNFLFVQKRQMFTLLLSNSLPRFDKMPRDVTKIHQDCTDSCHSHDFCCHFLSFDFSEKWPFGCGRAPSASKSKGKFLRENECAK